MRLVMAGLDYTTADMDVRDVFSPGAGAMPGLLSGLAGDDVVGCVLLATCNRTELYLSYQGDVPPDGAELLCRAFGRDARPYLRYFIERHERQAVMHLMQVSAGMQSSVQGDDQIITQVRSAIEAAREAKTADPLLEAVFRSAVAAGKKVKTRTSFARNGSSVARRAVDEAAKRLGGLGGKRALVIGNGAVGLLTAAALAEAGCSVTVTLRDPRRRSELPAGCDDVDFGDRHRAMRGCDVVVSATSSPRHTIALAELDGLRDLPGLFIDLAVPRDIEPAVAGFPGTTLLNVDDLRTDEAENATLRRQIDEADAIIAEEAGRFDLWRRNRRRHTRVDPGEPDFPIFINLHGASVLVAGGGRVAARRTEKLLAFGARVHVVAPEIAPEMAALVGRGNLTWSRGHYQPHHMEGVTLAIAATDDRAVNEGIGRDARGRGVLVSVADRRQECTFYFPAIVRSDRLTAGVVSNNNDHGMVKRAAARLREEMEAIDAEDQGGDAGQPVGGGAGAPGHGRHTARPS